VEIEQIGGGLDGEDRPEYHGIMEERGADQPKECRWTP
jgi:hypothetical protein